MSKKVMRIVLIWVSIGSMKRYVNPMSLSKSKSCSVRNALLALASVLLAATTHAEMPEFKLTIEQHRFAPDELLVPAGQKFRLVVENRDGTPEEFESYDLNREKVVAARSSIVVFLGPLKPGSYEFFGDFNPKLARGRIVAK
jgi:hypothetical protein